MPQIQILDSCVLSFQLPHPQRCLCSLWWRVGVRWVCPLHTVTLPSPARWMPGLRGSNCFCNTLSVMSTVCSFTSTSRGTCNWQLPSLLKTLKYKIRCFSNFSLPALTRFLEVGKVTKCLSSTFQKSATVVSSPIFYSLWVRLLKHSLLSI